MVLSYRKIFLRPPLVLGGLVVLIACLVEIGIRESGLVDFPIYTIDGEIGYTPKANQAGRFLGKNAWVFNDRSMGIDRPWQPDESENTLLIGNSVVLGGNPYDQKDKLGPLIQHDMGQQDAIWPIAAGGWTNVNETIFLERHPEVVAATRFFVWEFMAGGLSKATKWEGDYIWPRERPLWATWYVFRHDVIPRLVSVRANELPPTGGIDPAALRRFTDMIDRLAFAIKRPAPGLLFL
jgi:hypothetical protein